MVGSKADSDKPAWRRRRKGQSLVELALAMPVLLILLSGLMEFGFALNQYLNALDAAREGARFAADGDPTKRDLRFASAPYSAPKPCSLPAGDTNPDDASSDFYILTSCVAQNTMAPVPLNPATDDIVISVFRVLNGHIYGRWPDCGNSLSSGHAPSSLDSTCPNDPPFIAHSGNWPETMGEWHQWGRGDQCANTMDDNGDGNVNEGCNGATGLPGPGESSCDPNADYTCNPSRFTSAQVEAVLDPHAPNTAVVLVEVFYNYNQLLKLPWITAFVPDPQRLHSYTIIPVPAAEPTLIISGTVTDETDPLNVHGKADVTVNFSNGIVAVTDSLGHYSASGFDTTPITVTATFPGCVPNPLLTTTGQPQWNLTPAANVPGVDFVANCPVPNTPTPTITPTPLLSPTPTQTGTPTTTPTATPSPTITPTPSSTSICSTAVYDAGKSTMSLVSPVNGIVQSDGTSAATLVVTLLDECGNAMPGQLVSLTSSRGGTDVIQPASSGSDTTNSTGQAFFTVKSSTMSTWDTSGTPHWDPSVLSAHYGANTLPDTSNVTFVCVVGQGLPVGGNNEVFWQFTNNTGLARRLVELDVNWTGGGGKLLQVVQFASTTIWSKGAGAPTIISSGWVGSPTARNIPNDNQPYPLLATFNFLVTGGQDYSAQAFWDDGNGNSKCQSNYVTVTRGGVTTPTATNTSSPTATPTTTANTATPTATSTPMPTGTPTQTGTPMPTGTPTPTPTVTPTSGPTSTFTPTATATQDTTGPVITNLVANPSTVSTGKCNVTFSANITDPAGIASASVSWSTNKPAASGSLSMTGPAGGGTWSTSPMTVTLTNGSASLTWAVVATDALGNAATPVSGTPVATTGTQCS